MATPADLIALLFKSLAEIQNANYSRAAACTFLACDLVVSFPDEIQHIWNASWSFPKVLYLIARYYGLFFVLFVLGVNSSFHHSIPFCQRYYYFFSIAGAIFFTNTVNCIFIIRVFALSGRNMKVLWTFIFLCFVEFALELYSSIDSGIHSSAGVIEPPLPIWPGCMTVYDADVRLHLISLVPCVIVAFMFFAYALYKFRDSFRDDQGRVRFDVLKDQRYISPILMIMMRDGVAFFFMIFAILMVVILFFTDKSSSIKSLSAHPWLIAIYSISGCHLVLNIRKAGGRGMPTSLNDTIGGISGDDYAMPIFKLPKPLDASSTMVQSNI